MTKILPVWLTRKNVLRGYASLQAIGITAFMGYIIVPEIGNTSHVVSGILPLLAGIMMLLASLGMVLLLKWAAVFVSCVSFVGSLFVSSLAAFCILDMATNATFFTRNDESLIFIFSVSLALLVMLTPAVLTWFSWKELK
jgi:glucan phosphoethanolaminetransferase (alkaline phosphatase superfamily)